MSYEFALLIDAASRLDADAFVAQFPEDVFWVETQGKGTTRFMTSIEPVEDGNPAVFVAPIRKREGANGFRLMITIGRGATNDIVVEAQDVSKFHAYVMVRPEGAPPEDGYKICDAGSTCGTRVNSIDLAVREPHPLSNGAEVELGSALLTYLEPASLYTRLGLLSPDTDATYFKPAEDLGPVVGEKTEFNAADIDPECTWDE